MTKKETSFAGWVRGLVMVKPDLTFDELKEEFAKSGRPASEKPKSKQVVYAARSAVKTRWGVEAVELPRAKDGSLNMSGLVRLYLDKFGDGATEKKAISYFANDGIELKAGSFANAKTTYLRKKGSLDTNVGTGPRARHLDKKRRKPGRKGRRMAQPVQSSPDVQFDLLIQTKDFIKNVGGIDQARQMLGLIEEIQTLRN